MIAIASDHGGYKLKEEIKNYFDSKNIKYKDFGTDSEERTDYPIYASAVSKAIQNKECEKGILICRTGFGMGMVANKYKGIRCATCYSKETAKQAKEHSNINILSLPGDYVGIEEAKEIINIWIESQFLGDRYQKRLNMIEEIEKENMK